MNIPFEKEAHAPFPHYRKRTLLRADTDRENISASNVRPNCNQFIPIFSTCKKFSYSSQMYNSIAGLTTANTDNKLLSI